MKLLQKISLPLMIVYLDNYSNSNCKLLNPWEIKACLDDSTLLKIKHEYQIIFPLHCVGVLSVVFL